MACRRSLNIGCHDHDIAEITGYPSQQGEAGAVDTIVVRNEEPHLNLEQVTLIHNPTSGDGRPSAEDLTRILEKSGFQVRYQSSKKDWKKALQRDADLVAIAGGDGTVAKVLTELRGSATPVGIIPVGTANNISRSLGIHGDAREIVAGWRESETRPFDVGVASAGSDELSFVESAGGGLFAQLMVEAADEVDKAGSIVGSELDRALVHLRRQIETAPEVEWKVEIDGEDRSGHFIAVEAMNIRHAGPSVPLAPDADPGDGLLDVVLIRGDERDALHDYIDERLAQHEIRLPALMVFRGRRIKLSVDDLAMRIDDKVVRKDGGSWKISLDQAAVRVLG